jgi:hypothetical protein
MSWQDRLWQNFPELTLFTLLVITGLAHHSLIGRSTPQPEALRWIEGIIGQILASLLTLLVKKGNTTTP